MDAPLSFENLFDKKRVCKLKSPYMLSNNLIELGLRDFKSLKRYGFTQSQGDHALFFKWSSLMKLTVLIVNVDDIIVKADDLEEIKNLKTFLRYFLGM